jgi:methyl halide transferase
MNTTLNSEYWNTRWQTGQTGWDIGYAAPALTEYINQLPGKNISILVPGCGNAYEAMHLVQQGFTNITLLDVAETAVNNLREKLAKEKINILCGDFFEHEEQYDLILEQTFFCALPPEQRSQYAQQSASLLKTGGKIAGVLFNRTFETEGPPFGGNAAEYRLIFEPWFHIHKMEPCYNSIPPRSGTELFIILSKK